MLKSDFLLASWTICSWMPYPCMWLFLIFVALMDLNFSLIGLGAIILSGSLAYLALYAMRKALHTKGYAKEDLNLISQAINRAAGASVVVAAPFVIAILCTMAGASALLGFYDTFSHGLHVIAQWAIALTVSTLSAYAGWQLKGKKVYAKHTRDLYLVGSL